MNLLSLFNWLIHEGTWILAAARFYLIPILWGKVLYEGIAHFQASLHSKKPALSILLPVYFALGTLGLFIAASSLSAIQHYNPWPIFSQVFFPLAHLVALVAAGQWLWNSRLRFNKVITIQFFFFAFTILCTTSLALAIWHYQTPHPLDWDLYEHQTLAQQHLAGQWHFFTSQLSDTFGFASYPPTFHTLLAISQSGLHLTAGTILHHWWLLASLHLITISMIAYGWGWYLTRNQTVAIVSGMMGGLVFESSIAFTSFFILPQTVTAVLWAGLLLSYFQSPHLSKSRLHFHGLIGAITLVIFHYIVGTLAALILVAFWFCSAWPNLYQKTWFQLGLLLLTTLSCISWWLFSTTVDLRFINQGEAASYTFAWWEKHAMVLRIYSWWGYLGLALGVLAALLYKNLPSKTLFICLTLGLLTLLVSPFPYALKFFVLARFVLHFWIALALSTILNSLRYNFTRTLGISLVFSYFGLVLFTNLTTWKYPLQINQEYRHLAEAELQAADFLRQKYHPTSTLLIGDPSTQYILEGLSGVNSAGGVFMTATNRQFLSTSSLLSAPDLHRQLLEIDDKLLTQPTQRLFVVSGRWFVWQNSPEKHQSLDFNVWRPQPLSWQDRLAIERLATATEYFSLVYQNTDLAIFELK